METVLVVTESQYREILKWEDDGGAPRNITYQIIPDKNEEVEESELVMSAK